MSTRGIRLAVGGPPFKFSNRVQPNNTGFQIQDRLWPTPHSLNSTSGYLADTLRLAKFECEGQVKGGKWRQMMEVDQTPLQRQRRLFIYLEGAKFLREAIFQHAIPRNLRTYPSSKILPPDKNSQPLTMYSKCTRNRARYGGEQIIVVASASRDERRHPWPLHKLVIEARNICQDIAKCEAVKSQVYILTTAAKTHYHQENKEPIAVHCSISTVWMGYDLSRNNRLSNDYASNSQAVSKLKSPRKVPSCPRFSVYELPLSSLQSYWVDSTLHSLRQRKPHCSPANFFDESRLALIPTLELRFAFHRAFMNLYHEQKFGAERQKETISTRFFKRLVSGKGKMFGLKGGWKRLSAFFTGPLT
ncbi:hypothetical protein EDD85DRAFT_798738 [Armillaria nabsnona]|nr:hypothetical protein EDD85DRAFT_798738 [Armillaria nabsnona]